MTLRGELTVGAVVLVLLTSPSLLVAFEVIEGIRMLRNGGGPSLALTPANEIAVASYDGGLNYSTYVNGRWVTETTGGNLTGVTPDLAFTSGGDAHVSYYQFPDWYYALRSDEGEWSHEKLPGTDLGIFSDLEFDSDDAPHIASVGFQNFDLNYATKEGAATWSTSVLDTDLLYYSSVGLALDSRDQPHVVYAYKMGGHHGLRHAYISDNEWRFESLFATERGIAGAPSIAIDSNDRIHVSFIGEGNLLYATKSNAGWNTEIVESNSDDFVEGFGPHQTAIVLLPGEIPAIAHNNPFRDVRFAKKSNAGLWDIAVISEGTIWAPSMIVDADGMPVVGWRREDNGVMYEIAVVTQTPSLQAGDANQNLTFDTGDLVMALQAGKYESGEAASWSQGDWNGAPGGFPGFPPEGDGVFDSGDLVAAFTAGFYEQGSYGNNAVPAPEPSTMLLLMLAIVNCAIRYRHRSKPAS